MLILPITVDLHELLENSVLAAIAFLCKSGRVVVMAVHFAFVLVIAVLSAKDGRTQGTGEMLDVVFAVECGDVRASERRATRKTQ